MQRFYYLSLLLLLFGTLSAQEAVLHLDRPYHAAGEVSRFQVYLPQPAPSLVRTEIYAPDGQLVDYFFLRSANGSAAGGYHRWAYDLPTGFYRLRFTALTQDGETVNLGTFRHAVYNVTDGDGAQVAKTVETGAASPESLALQVNDGQIRATGLPPGAYSLSVHNREVTGPGANVLTVPGPESDQRYQDTLFYGGLLTDAGQNSPLAVNLLPFFDTRTLETYFSKSYGDGAFSLTVPSFQGEKQVQARGVQDEAVRARLVFPPLEPITDQPPLTEEVAQYLDLSKRRRKIYQLYGSVETPLDGVPDTQAVKKLAPNKVYDVQDYQTFPDMLTFFNEVAGELRIRRRRGELTANLYNAPTQRFFTGTPLFIIDGRLTRDVDYVAALAPANVGRLAYYYDNRELRRDFPALGGDGVVQIDLLRDNGKFPQVDAVNLLRLGGLLPAQEFERPQNDAPRLSPLLLWEAGQTEGGTLSVPLPPTDDAGTYEVVLVVRDRTTGAVRSGRAEVTLAASR